MSMKNSCKTIYESIRSVVYLELLLQDFLRKGIYCELVSWGRVSSLDPPGHGAQMSVKWPFPVDSSQLPFLMLVSSLGRDVDTSVSDMDG